MLAGRSGSDNLRLAPQLATGGLIVTLAGLPTGTAGSGDRAMDGILAIQRGGDGAETIRFIGSFFSPITYRSHRSQVRSTSMVVRSMLLMMLALAIACSGDMTSPSADFAKGAKGGGGTITVTSLLDDGSAGTLRSVINAAPSGSKVVFASTLCAPGSTPATGCKVTVGGVIGITENLTVSGPTSYRLAVDGGGLVPVLDIGNGDTVSIKNLTISDGFGATFGGAIHITANSAVTLTHVTVMASSAIEGGGIFIEPGATVAMTNDSVADGNIVVTQGGGIWNGGTLTMTNVTVWLNEIGPSISGQGAGIYNIGTLTGSGDTVKGNLGFAGTVQGGGIFNAPGGTVTLTNSAVSGNTTSSTSAGGGIFTVKGVVTLTGTTVSGNTSGVGGGIYTVGTPLTLTNSAVTGNTAVEAGGISGQDSTITLTNTTITGNRSTVAATTGILYVGQLLVLQKGTCINNNTAASVLATNPWDGINVGLGLGVPVIGLNCGVVQP